MERGIQKELCADRLRGEYFFYDGYYASRNATENG